MERQFILFILTFTTLFISFAVQVNAQLADGKCKFLGNVIGNSAPSTFSTYWNQVTPENAGKWGTVEATRDVMNWNGLDNAYHYAKNNGFLFKQHTFVWGQQQPAWIDNLMNDTSIPMEERYEEVRGEVEEWIKLFSERYPDVDFIDVVNEPFHAAPSYASALGTGWDWVAWAFQKARQYCPNAKLILNEYNIINNDAATNSYIDLINTLKEQNLIDGIGIQCHRFEIESAPVSQLEDNLDKLAATGLPIFITEFDIGNIDNTSSGNSTTDDSEQLEIYQRVFPVIWEHKAVQGITLWGYIQGQTWQSTAYLLRSNGTERPALAWLKSYIPTVSGGTFCLPVTGIEEGAPPADIYPNPVTDGNFTLALGEGKFDVRILDLNGREIKHMEISNTPAIDLTLRETSGVYILQVSDGHTNIFRKIFVE